MVSSSSSSSPTQVLITESCRRYPNVLLTIGMDKIIATMKKNEKKETGSHISHRLRSRYFHFFFTSLWTLIMMMMIIIITMVHGAIIKGKLTLHPNGHNRKRLNHEAWRIHTYKVDVKTWFLIFNIFIISIVTTSCCCCYCW